MPATLPVLTLQTGTLYASGDNDTFSGTGGPFGFSPFTGQFGGTVSSGGLAADPFNDTLSGVSPGDDVTFVIAVQNMTAGAPAFNVRLRDTMPAGFVVPSGGIGLTVTDGANNDLSTSGDLFGASGLTIDAPLQGYDASSGANVALITFSLDAGSALAGPFASLSSTASVTGYAASPSGPDLSAANPASASTVLVTAAPRTVVTAETDPSAVASGQTVAFDVTVTVPTGTLPDFTITPALPAGQDSLQLVSSRVVSVGSALQAGPPVMRADGSISFGTVTLPQGAVGGTTIVTRMVVRAEGAVSGRALLQTTISAGDATSSAGVFTNTVQSSVGVVAPPPPPTLSGLSTALGVSLTAHVSPFAGFTISDGNAQTGTLAITLLDPSLGTLGVRGAGTVDQSGSTFTVTGTLASLVAAARAVTFTPKSVGTAGFTVTVIDSAGGVAQNSGATVTITAAQVVADPLFDASYYLAHNPDVAASGMDPLRHYELYGWHEGRNPSASFDTADYLAANPDVKAAGVDPLLHYDLHGQAEGRAAIAVPATAPDPLVDAAFYDAANPDVRAAGVDASVHYLAHGWVEGRDPSAFFDTSYYLAQNPDVRAAGIDPLLHFERYGWREGRDPSLMFSDSKYLAAYPDVAAAGTDPLLHYTTNGQFEGRLTFLAGGTAAADPLIDAAFYDHQLGATLIPGGTAGAQQAAWSYDATGWQKGLNPDALFDTTYYLAHNPDVAAAHVDPLLHYEQFGWQEGRDPSAAFSTTKYLAAYADVRQANIDPLLHYLQHGQAEGRQAFTV